MCVYSAAAATSNTQASCCVSACVRNVDVVLLPQDCVGSLAAVLLNHHYHHSSQHDYRQRHKLVYTNSLFSIFYFTGRLLQIFSNYFLWWQCYKSQTEWWVMVVAELSHKGEYIHVFHHTLQGEWKHWSHHITENNLYMLMQCFKVLRFSNTLLTLL